MPKKIKLTAKAYYRDSTHDKYKATNMEIDWDGQILYHKEDFFGKKLDFCSVTDWSLADKPVSISEKPGSLKTHHIIRLSESSHGKPELREFALPPDIFEIWLYWIIRSLVKHSKIFVSKERIKQIPLLEKHKLKTIALGNLSIFERSHQIFLKALTIRQNPSEIKKRPNNLEHGEGGSSFGRIGKTLGKGSSGASLVEIMKVLAPIKIGEQMAGEPVAMKILNLVSVDEEAVTNFIKEVRVLALLGKHPNIVGLIDTLLTDSRLCLFMEMGFCDLKNLREERGALSRSDVLVYTQNILEGIAHMHKYRVYHLDMKTENVIICGGKGKRDIAKIIDFGFSRSATLQIKPQRFAAPVSWDLLGTSGYISPESWDLGQNNITSETFFAKKDSFAVGMTIINGLLAPFLGMEEVKVNFDENKAFMLERIETWQKRLSDRLSKDKLIREGLSDLAEAAIGLIEVKPELRLTVEDALRLIRKNEDMIFKKGFIEIVKI